MTGRSYRQRIFANIAVQDLLTFEALQHYRTQLFENRARGLTVLVILVNETVLATKVWVVETALEEVSPRN